MAHNYKYRVQVFCTRKTHQLLYAINGFKHDSLLQQGNIFEHGSQVQLQSLPKL